MMFLEPHELDALEQEAARLGFDEQRADRLLEWALAARMTSVLLELLASGQAEICREESDGEFSIRLTESGRAEALRIVGAARIETGPETEQNG
ncbi:MAG: hypothetical protein IPM64_17870 [Phycisphaerales bacterium]|nr:hypothetical protein [Phycisphaerales bacterium]